MRVLQVLPGLKTDGIAVVATNYYKFIDKAKVQFDFAVENKLRNKYDDFIEESGGRIFRLPNHASGVRNVFGFIKTLKRLVKEEDYKVVHVHSNSSVLLFLAGLSVKQAKKKTKVVFSSHSRSCEQLLLHKLFRPFLRNLADVRLACSAPAGTHMYGKQSYQLFSNAIDFQKYSFNPEKREAKRQELSLSDSFVLGFSGRISPPKNPLYLLDVFQLVKQTIPSAKLLICGDGLMMDQLQSRIEKEQVDGVICTGSVDSTEDYLSAMDVLLAPSLYEGLPMALLEAQANGLPCICSENIPQEAIFAHNVHTVPLDDTAGWASTAAQLLNVPRHSCTINPAETGYDITAESAKLLDFYSSLT